MEKEIKAICNAISFQMGEWPTIFETVPSYLDYLLFTIGSGVEFDPDTHSPLIGKVPMHKFRAFDREAKQLANKGRWVKRLEERFSSYDFRDNEWKAKAVERELARHVYPVIEPSDLNRDVLHEQIAKSADDPRRKSTIVALSEQRGEDDEYKYVRPYPLSFPSSRVYQITEQSPKGLIWVAREFCHAWFNYLSADLETGNFYKGPEISYTNEEWTRKHCEAIGELAAKFDSLLSS